MYYNSIVNKSMQDYSMLYHEIAQSYRGMRSMRWTYAHPYQWPNHNRLNLFDVDYCDRITSSVRLI